MALIDIVRTACGELGIGAPVSVIGSADGNTTQLLALSNRAGVELAGYPVKDSCWSVLQKQYLFSTNFLASVATVTTGSNVLTLASTTGILPGFGVSGQFLPNACVVLSVTPTTVTLNATQTATANNTGTYTFSQIGYALPADYDHALNQTFWDRNYRWQLMGPISPQEWGVLKSGIAPTGPRLRFRIFNNLMYVDPYPTSLTTIAYDYISNGWCTSATGTAQVKWTADTDLSLFPEELMILSLIWRFRRAKGLSYDEERDQYEKSLERTAARDGGGARSLMINRTSGAAPIISSSQIPDAGYGT